jgi:iron(III) transport system substrate-binding protein
MWRGGSEEILQRAVTEARGRRYDFDVVETAAPQIEAIYREKLLAEVTTPVAADMIPEATIAGRPWLPSRLIVFTGAYNTKLVKPSDRPRSYEDLLDPKWKGKMVKAHPGYSGNIMTGTYILSKLLGWNYFEALAKQQIMQVQSAVDPAQRVAQGERLVAADGSENSAFRTRRKGGAVVPIYPTEGCPVVPVGAAIMAAAPHPNAARLLVHFILSPEGQQTLADYGGRSFLPGIAVPEGLKPTEQLKLLHAEPLQVAEETEMIRKRYTSLFAI